MSDVSANDAANPPPLVSPVAAFEVRAVLDQDAYLTAGLAVDALGERVVMLVATRKARPGEREEFLEWARALRSVEAVSRIARSAGYGHTDDGRPFLATYVDHSLADMLRRVGAPNPKYVRQIGSTLADALATAHSYGLVHGAVSPATVLMVGDGVRLGGFGATAPGLTAPLGVWAFTAPEHRTAAAAGEIVGSPAADVFALAATICVAYAGVLPWSDPVSWADVADLPDEQDAPAWVRAIRTALDADPDQRPTAEDFAAALREMPAVAPATLPASTIIKTPGSAASGGAKVDLRGLMPRQVRRLAANSVDAMADGQPQAVGRAVAADGPVPVAPAVPADAVPAQRGVARVSTFARTHRRATGLTGTLVALVALMVAYFSAGPSAGQASTPRPLPTVTGTEAPVGSIALLDGARQTGEDFLRGLGRHDPSTCSLVHGRAVITVPHHNEKVTCSYLLGHVKAVFGARGVAAFKSASVLQAVNYDAGQDTSGNTVDPDMHAFISLPFVPALDVVVDRFEMVLTFRDGIWWIVEVTFG